ncbi:hypothetical protein K443DRAFT_676822 [Laccaria amethystina LaAM-08-1]|uniref:FHA domain-containing protein n=1 Tax=Laccaria amethystina LaAM-08-1 TaxID=1095629 RepID=A0A0C9Y023_9AGAR|nr:hypothetical protein K443DRAFT_676822 [Laccaria amethystina LaAM-08-1]
MVHHSRSPSRRQRGDDEDQSLRRGSDYRRIEKTRDEGGYERRSRETGGSNWGRDDERPRREERRPDRREYREDDRERERNRDRERYNNRAREGDRDHDRDYVARSSNRHPRSASPPSRTSRPRDVASGSKSPGDEPPVDMAKPNFAPSGLLAAETNTVKAVDGTSTVLKYNEPPEARKPVLGWRLYVFRGSEQLELLHIHRQSAYLIGRDRLVADIAIDHPSCSKQHAVIQYRYVQEKDEFGDSKGTVKPFVIDLESTNGTHVNDEVIPSARYYELKASDVIKFGQSTREYVLLHDEVS